MRAASPGVSARRSASAKHGKPPSHSAAPSSCAPVANMSMVESLSRAAAWLVAAAAASIAKHASATATRIDGSGLRRIDTPTTAAESSLMPPATTKPAPAMSRHDKSEDAASTVALITVAAQTLNSDAITAALTTRHVLRRIGRNACCARRAKGTTTTLGQGHSQTPTVASPRAHSQSSRCSSLSCNTLWSQRYHRHFDSSASDP